MSIALKLHELFNRTTPLQFPFDGEKIPKNGIYIIFEKGENVGELKRIVRVGTHTGNNQLLSRLKQHFCNNNKDRSIFSKNVGRCILNNENPSYLPFWELDLTPKKDREKKEKLIDANLQQELEKRISEYIQNNLSFCVFEVNSREDRLRWERKLISTLSNAAKAGEIKPSEGWLGNHSTKPKIKESGLWQVNELYKESLTEEEYQELEKLVKLL